MAETMKASALIGRLVTLEVREPVCRVSWGGMFPLIDTTRGRIQRIVRMPGGPVGILETEDGRRIVFDAGLDIAGGKLAIVLEDEAP